MKNIRAFFAAFLLPFSLCAQAPVAKVGGAVRMNAALFNVSDLLHVIVFLALFVCACWLLMTCCMIFSLSAGPRKERRPEKF